MHQILYVPFSISGKPTSRMSVTTEESVMAMLAMMIVLSFVLVIYCFIPAYRAFKKRQEQEENFWETDPRWNDEKFMFAPNFPTNYMDDKKYSRLACSRNSRSVLSPQKSFPSFLFT